MESAAKIHQAGIPDELVEAILLRLPVESLLKFRCVSKSWHYLISSKRFVQSQVDFAANNKLFPRLSLEEPHTFIGMKIRMKQYNVNALLNKLDEQAPNLYYPTCNRSWKTSFELLGSYNGLCCAWIQSGLFVWNPSTRVCRALPHIGVVGVTTHHCILNMGFGFDGNDYKVFAKYHDSVKCRSVAKLYSLRANSWKIVPPSEELARLTPDHERRQGKFANMKIYWLTSKLHIVHFDLESEAWGTEHLPPEVADHHNKELAVLAECLCLCSGEINSRTNVWILKQGEPWNKIISVDFESCSGIVENTMPIPVFMTGEGEILISYKLLHATGFISYDTKTRSLKQLGNTIRGLLRTPTIVYIPSLGSPVLDD